MANFKDLTRYTGALVAKDRSGEDFLILRRQLGLEPEEGDTFITITQDIEKRPDLMSSRVYGTPDLWWVIYEFNGIRDPFFELKQGTSLRIPALERVLDAISELENN